MRTGEPALDDDDEFVFERRCRGLKFGIPLRRIVVPAERTSDYILIEKFLSGMVSFS